MDGHKYHQIQNANIDNHFDITGNLVFNPEVESLQPAVDKLIASGVNKIIALGHSGIDTDMDIAQHVQGIDIVVGGHTNTFMYTGKNLFLFLKYFIGLTDFRVTVLKSNLLLILASFNWVVFAPIIPCCSLSHPIFRPFPIYHHLSSILHIFLVVSIFLVVW